MAQALLPIAAAVPPPAQPAHMPAAQVQTGSPPRAVTANEQPIHAGQPGLWAATGKAETDNPLPAKSDPAVATANSAPLQANSAAIPAFDKPADASQIVSETQAGSTVRASMAEIGGQPGTKQAAELHASHALHRVDDMVSSRAAQVPADRPGAAPSVTPQTRKSAAAAVAAPIASDAKPASPSKGIAAKAAETRERSHVLHEQAVHPAANPSGAAARMQPAVVAARDTTAVNVPNDAKASGGAQASQPVSSTTAPAAHDTFAALDTAAGAGVPTWIHAGAHHAEAGFQDPALGWVGVRAQTDANGIHAVLVPGSADAAQSLNAHLAGLNAYLTDHQTPVATLTLAAQQNNWAGQGMMGQGSGQNAGQGGHPGQHPEAGFASSATMPASRSHGAAAGGGSETRPAGPAPGGAYISVMA